MKKFLFMLVATMGLLVSSCGVHQEEHAEELCDHRQAARCSAGQGIFAGTAV